MDEHASNWEEFKEYLKGADDSLSQVEKNQPWNFTLLDSSTNRSYGNAIFSAKRRIIVGKDQGKKLPIPTLKSIKVDYENEVNQSPYPRAQSPFIPLCTKYVFLKYYTNVSTDYNYWTKSDAMAYEANMVEMMAKFGVKSTRNLKK